jgi:hypothetical protein
MLPKIVRLEQSNQPGRTSVLGWKCPEMRLLGREKNRLNNNIKMNLNETVSACDSRMQLAQDHAKWHNTGLANLKLVVHLTQT